MNIDVTLAIKDQGRSEQMVRACQTLLTKHLQNKYSQASVAVEVDNEIHNDHVAVSNCKTERENVLRSREIAAKDLFSIIDMVEKHLKKAAG